MICDQDATQLYRRLFGRYPTGVAVCLTGDPNHVEGMTINSLSSVSLKPLLVSFCARHGSRTAQLIKETESFSINLLTARQEMLSRHFAGAPTTHIHRQLVRRRNFWCVDEANASFLCELMRWVPLGDHDMLVGRVVEMCGPEAAHPPLMYFQGGYASPVLDRLP